MSTINSNKFVSVVEEKGGANDVAISLRYPLAGLTELPEIGNSPELWYPLARLTELPEIGNSPELWYYQQRTTELANMQDLYPHSFRRSCTLAEYRNRYDHLGKNESLLDVTESVAGRIQTIRTSSAKLYFIVIESDGVFLQVLANAKFYPSIDLFKNDKKYLGRSDIIGVTGHPTRSATGELSILPNKIQLLAPCLHMVPKDADSFNDDGIRFRQRYLDLILHPGARDIFKTRAHVNRFMRSYLDTNGFIEVETPIVSTKLGGANAKPFITHHNDLDKKMYMRIAPELYLKQLVIGGMEKVYELGKQFRNESQNYNHHTEFSSIEIYQAYADYESMIEMVQEIFSKLVFMLNGSYILEYDQVNRETGVSNKVKIDFMPPFKRFDLMTDLQKYGGFVFPQEILNNFDSNETRLYLEKLCREKQIKCSDPKTTPRLLDKLVGEYLEPLCINPTFIMNHPQIMSPLAKFHRENKLLTERFELFILGSEYANAYTELNDPVIQKNCFIKQEHDKKLGDDEAQIRDDDYVTALEFGLPPTAGLGIGLDRLIMLLSNKSAIKEVITFPY